MSRTAARRPDRLGHEHPERVYRMQQKAANILTGTPDQYAGSYEEDERSVCLTSLQNSLTAMLHLMSTRMGRKYDPKFDAAASRCFEHLGILQVEVRWRRGIAGYEAVACDGVGDQIGPPVRASTKVSALDVLEKLLFERDPSWRTP